MLSLTNGKSTSNNGYSLFLSGEELDEVRELFEDLPHKSSPFSLEFSVTLFAQVCDVLCDYEVTSENAEMRKKIKKRKPPVMVPKKNPVLPTFLLKPHPHQREAVMFGIEHQRFLLGDVMGLGKTGSTIYFAEILKAFYGFKHCLIICGVNGAKFNWHQIEIPKFSHESSHIIGGRVNRNGNFVIDAIPARVADLQAPHDEFYLIINIESLRSKPVLDELERLVVSGDIGMVVIDEIHLCSGHSSAQGKAIHRLLPKFRVGLTGTPLHNKPLDIYNIMKWLGYEYRNFDTFRSEYCYTIPQTTMRNGDFQVFNTYVYKDLSMLHEKLKKFMLRRTVEVLHLPTPIFKDEYVELDKTQLMLYNKIKEDILKAEHYTGMLTAETLITNPGVQFIKARQAVSCPIVFGVQADAKLERVKEVIKEAFEDGKSVVVFAWFNATVNHYLDVLSGIFRGSVIGVTETTNNVQDKVTEFQTSTEPKVIIGTIGKLGTSFTITKADLVIFVDKHVMWSQYEQAYMRVWRQGQTKNVVILNIMAKDTIDERLEFLIAKGRSHAEQVVDGINRPEELLPVKYTPKAFL